MRVIAYLLLATILLHGTLAVTQQASQKKLLVQKISRHLEKTVYGRALKNMVLLAAKLKYDYTDLNNAFNALIDQLANREQDENTLYDSQTLHHNNQVEIIQTAIDKFTVEVNEYTKTVEDLNQDIEDAEATLELQQNELTTAQQNLQNALTEKQNLIDAHDKDVEDFNDAIDFIAQAVSSLSVAQQNYESSSLDDYSLFVQVRNDLMASYSVKMIEKTKNMRGAHQLFIKPVVLTLNQMSQADQSSIEIAIDALNNLSAYFQNALAQANTIFANDLDSVNGRIQAFTVQIDLLENTLIPSTEDLISNLKGQLEIAENNLEISQENLADAEQNLVNENEEFDNITRRHNALINKIESESLLVQEAQAIIDDALASQEE